MTKNMQKDTSNTGMTLTISGDMEQNADSSMREPSEKCYRVQIKVDMVYLLFLEYMYTHVANVRQEVSSLT